ncbi:MAG: NADH:flavin oxidoreductase/NADH oxidase [Nitrospirae bacterium]|nr:NADH:flavin oxidoreductase/NADH oxidase [Candidatus Manganitrophaceae bacterium]
MAGLFEPFTLRDITFQNRIVVSPMCQYSSRDGFANDWHLVHLGSRAVGGAGLVFTEAAAVLPEGRISPQDLGIWSDPHIAPLKRITCFIQEQGSFSGIQLAHAGRKASTYRPWEGQGVAPEAEGGWRKIVAPSPLPFAEGYGVPEALTEAGIQEVVNGFAEAARRALEAGFSVIEIHAAHGYLLHEFLSPFSNRRPDRYGGSFENRTRLLREVVTAIRGVWPDRLPLFARISATDWAPGGWDIDESIELARQLNPLGVDLFDCSSGGNRPDVKIPVAPGYQVPFAERIRREAGLPTGAVGLITSPTQAEEIIRNGRADLVLLARAFLRDPYWPLHAASEFDVPIPWPPQYLRAAPKGTPARVPVDSDRLERCFAEHHAIMSEKKEKQK